MKTQTIVDQALEAAAYKAISEGEGDGKALLAGILLAVEDCADSLRRIADHIDRGR